MLHLTKGILLCVDAATGILHWPTRRDLDWRQVPLQLWVTLTGTPDPDSGLLVNVRDIKLAVQQALTEQDIAAPHAAAVLDWARRMLSQRFPQFQLLRLELLWADDLTAAWSAEDTDMILVTRKYELAAAHRLARRQWDDDRNVAEFGKCSNPAGHGHNYILEVTVAGKPDPATGRVCNLEALDKLVNEHIVERFDHKNLNEDTEEFTDLMPTVENMTQVFWELLIGRFQEGRLHRVAVWETPTTFAEYFGPGAGPLRDTDMI